MEKAVRFGSAVSLVVDFATVSSETLDRKFWGGIGSSTHVPPPFFYEGLIYEIRWRCEPPLEASFKTTSLSRQTAS